MKFSKLRVSPKRNEEKIRENATRRPASPNAKAYELQKCLSDDGTLVLSDQDILSQNETMMFIDAEGGKVENFLEVSLGLIPSPSPHSNYERESSLEV